MTVRETKTQEADRQRFIVRDRYTRDIQKRLIIRDRYTRERDRVRKKIIMIIYVPLREAEQC